MKRRTPETITRDNKVIKYFIENPTETIIQISNATGIPKSTVQRILNDPDYVGYVIPSTNKTIKDQLEHNRLKGNSKGGRTTFAKYDALKGEKGKYTGLKKTETKEKETLKTEQIYSVVLFFSKYPYLTLDDLADMFDNVMTRDQVYDCLTDQRVFEIFGSVMAKSIINRLENNVFTILNKLPINFTIESMNAILELTEEEKEIIRRRLDYGNGIVSADKVAEDIGLSRASILKKENRAANKIKDYYVNMKKRVL